jgi:hypothetical protein
MRNNLDTYLDNLKKLASDLGASDSKVITPEMITIVDEILNLCQNPLCPRFGQIIRFISA